MIDKQMCRSFDLMEVMLFIQSEHTRLIFFILSPITKYASYKENKRVEHTVKALTESASWGG